MHAKPLIVGLGLAAALAAHGGRAHADAPTAPRLADPYCQLAADVVYLDGKPTKSQRIAGQQAANVCLKRYPNAAAELVKLGYVRAEDGSYVLVRTYYGR